MDNGKVTALTLLYLSAAFDTIDHATLLEQLHGHLGISGTVFQWFKSYISNRQQRVNIDGSLSCLQDLHFGVPQGSILGPFLFCLYITSISQIITTHDVSHHMYADDTQVYIELSQSDTHKLISSLSDCLTDISLWMKSSKQQLHWLPVNYRIKCKLYTLTCRALAIHQPPGPYLASLLHFSNIPIQLRSSTSQQLSIPRTKLNLGKRAFSVAAPIIWNKLPTTLKYCKILPLSVNISKLISSNLFFHLK